MAIVSRIQEGRGRNPRLTYFDIEIMIISPRAFANKDFLREGMKPYPATGIPLGGMSTFTWGLDLPRV